MRVKHNAPLHGMGEHGHASQKAPLKANAHTPQRVSTGNSDHKGYQGSADRRNGAHTGKLAKLDQNIRTGSQGNSKGSAPPGVGHGKGVMGSPATHSAHAGRGASGKFGKADKFTGQHSYPEDISHAQFESLGAK